MRNPQEVSAGAIYQQKCGELKRPCFRQKAHGENNPELLRLKSFGTATGVCSSDYGIPVLAVIPIFGTCFTPSFCLEVFQLPLPCLARVDFKDNCDHLHLWDCTNTGQHGGIRTK